MLFIGLWHNLYIGSITRLLYSIHLYSILRFNEDDKAYVEEYVLKEIEEFILHFDWAIISGIEKLIKLSVYYNSTYQLLHPNSNKFGKRLRFVIGKE